jgi:hypothetical protein
MTSLIHIGLPNISAQTVKKFLERKGFKLELDFRNAMLGSFLKGIGLPSYGKYCVLIACGVCNDRTWISRVDAGIPSGTRYILACQPRENLVHLWEP